MGVDHRVPPRDTRLPEGFLEGLRPRIAELTSSSMDFVRVCKPVRASPRRSSVRIPPSCDYPLAFLLPSCIGLGIKHA